MSNGQSVHVVVRDAIKVCSRTLLSVTPSLVHPSFVQGEDKISGCTHKKGGRHVPDKCWPTCLGTLHDIATANNNYAALSHLPNILMKELSIPTASAVVTVPILKL